MKMKIACFLPSCLTLVLALCITSPVFAEDKAVAEKSTTNLSEKIRITATDPVRVRDKDLPDHSTLETEVTFKNESEVEMVVYPFFDIKVEDAEGEPVKHDGYIGLGSYDDRVWIKDLEKKFLVIPAGESKSVTVNISGYQRPQECFGWYLTKPGTYRITLTYNFDLDQFVKNVENMVGENNEDWFVEQNRLWYKTLEMTRSMELKLEVKK